MLFSALSNSIRSYTKSAFKDLFLTNSKFSGEAIFIVLTFLLSLNFSTSIFNILPLGPEPFNKLVSISLCFAILFARGVINILLLFVSKNSSFCSLFKIG